MWLMLGQGLQFMYSQGHPFEAPFLFLFKLKCSRHDCIIGHQTHAGEDPSYSILLHET